MKLHAPDPPALDARALRDLPVLDNALATLECDVKQMIPRGDHHIIIGSVRAIDSRPGAPLVFFSGQFTSLGTVL